MTLTGTVVAGAYTSTATVTFLIVIIDSTLSYITPGPVSDLYYVIGDGNSVSTIGPVQNSDPTLATTGTLVRVDGVKVNPKLMTFDPVLGVITVLSTTDTTTIGSYPMVIEYNYVPMPKHIVNATFNIVILSACTRNTMTAPAMADETYYIAGA